MSPELTLRPSLSVVPTGNFLAVSEPCGVAGANAPAFVERPTTRKRQSRQSDVSPELTLRPSLSGRSSPRSRRRRKVSPELTLRPSLSVIGDGANEGLIQRVAGANAPAFVERPRPGPGRRPASPVSPELTLRPSLSDTTWPWRRSCQSRVAGANAPAFVERPEADARQLGVNCVAGGRCCMIQLRREWGRFSNFSFRTPQRRISAYPARPSG